MNLFELTSGDRTATMTLKHPVSGAPVIASDGKPVTFELYSTDSPTYQAAMEEAQRAYAQAVAMSGNDTPDPKVLKEKGVAVNAAAVAGWRGAENDQGPIEFSPTAAHHLVGALPFLREQIQEFIGRRANYLTKAQGES